MKRYNTPLIYNSSVEAIKLFLPYILQTNPDTGIIYGINSGVPVNPIFSSGLTVTSGFTYSNGTEAAGYALLTDGTGYSYWGPISAATPSSGVTSVTAGSGLSGNVTTGAITLVNTSPDQTVTITGGTNMQIVGTYPNFGINFTGTTGGNLLTVTESTRTGLTPTIGYMVYQTDGSDGVYVYKASGWVQMI